MKSLRTILFSIAVSALCLNASACDLCGCYTPQIETLSILEQNLSWTRGLYFGLAEQFTYFGTLQFDGHEIANPTGQYLDSSITQLVAGYSVNSRFAFQLNIPFIYRSFARPEGFAIDRGTESGFGDLSLLGKFVVFRHESGGRREMVFDDKSPRLVVHEPEFRVSINLLAGVKFPTGSTSRLTEEFNEVEIEGAPESGIHGHDLTLGMGSWDGLFGAESSVRYRRAFFEANAQFALRGDGAHQYHFANDLTWSAGPGHYIVQRPDLIVGLQFVVSGEHKDVDRFRGEKAEDTGITSVFIGPRMLASWRRFSGELSVDLPVLINNTALQAVPDYRLRAALAVSF